MKTIKKIHHISAIVGDPKENIAFYETILGLRLVKQTINFDDPETYHLYYGNYTADPGTIMTFFPWDPSKKGRVGSGQGGRIAFRIPKGSMAYWNERLTSFDIPFDISQLFGKPTMMFDDTHGLAIALVESETTADNPQIIGFHGAALLSSQPKDTMLTLKDDLGLNMVSENSENYHLETTGNEKHQIIIPKEKLPRGIFGTGTVHHIAWSVPTDTDHRDWQTHLYDERYNVTEIKDRQYFKAIYFIEKGNIVFELATDGPGFTINEPVEKLGERLMLPPQYDYLRAQLEKSLQPLREDDTYDFN
ncbi:VOC family protein [Vagococcus vulneris]|uniref:Ring-cleaving dioxygenase n=1 Tax=Vagococcus vulneris TaxID=1977869 RepID=A0A430A0A8_9ENTE|nr:VOC family protein [Vagococcus vulneris]RST99747.1 ring-cleaving dioxygenase [Vagococcus vulneris]